MNNNMIIIIINAIRNTLVFAPVALTWAAVGESTSAFAKYTKANSLSVTNYLDFWQNAQACGQPREVIIANLGVACSSIGIGR